MAKPRRIAFTTLHSAPSSSFRLSGRDGGDQPRDSLSAEPTVRISVPLFQPHDQRYPEFYYPDLVESARQEGEVDPWGGKKDLPDPFNIKEKERQDVEDLSGRRCRKDQFQDLIDMGYGYDESNSFIDNSEAYNEFIPASLDTKYGGFYINMEILEFQQVSESEDDYVKEKCPPKRKLKDGGEKMKKKGDSCNKVKKSKKSKFPKAGFMVLNARKEGKKKQHDEAPDEQGDVLEVLEKECLEEKR